MKKPRVRIVSLIALLIITISNYVRVSNNSSIRTIEFLSIFVIGALSGLLIHQVISVFRKE